VLGISSAESAPRYVPISKVRQVMKTSKIDGKDAGGLDLGGAAPIGRMFPPEVAERATMIAGSSEEVAARLAALIKEQGLI
jgi:electron transfer flavoprotein beta subunit